MARVRYILAIINVLGFTSADYVFDITSIDVPEYVDPSLQKGVEIECRYDADFTVFRWWKGRQEFFRYIPGGVPSTRSFAALGIGSIEVLACGPTACRLRLGGLTEEASGSYRCDLEREKPPHKFTARTAHMQVRGIGGPRPMLSGLQMEYGPGDTMEVTCQGAPGSQLRWYINGQEKGSARGAGILRLEVTRLLFMGSKAEAAVQCAEFSAGRLVGSTTSRAHWRDAHLPVSPSEEIPEEQRSCNSATFRCILNKVLVVVFCICAIIP